jgi:hypothetical protein
VSWSQKRRDDRPGRRRHALAGGERGGEPVTERLGVGALGQADERAVAHAAAGPDQPGAVEIRAVDQHPRAQRENPDRTVRLLLDGAGDGQLEIAHAEAVADPEPEAGEERIVHERAAAADQDLERARRLGHERPVEGIARLHRLELDDVTLRRPRLRHRHHLAHARGVDSRHR